MDLPGRASAAAAPQKDQRRMLATHQLNRLPAAERGITIADFLVPIRIGERMSARLRHIALIGIGAAFIALTANIAVWMPNNPVPITGQTLSVLVVGGALGLRRGAMSIAFYLVLGFFLPVYANQAHGLGTIAGFGARGFTMSPVGGYLISFLFAGALVGWLAEMGWDRHIGRAVGAMILGEVVIYSIGVPWLALSLNLSPGKAITTGLTPFIVGDAIKLAIAAGIFPFAWWLVGRRADDR
jgi:biotin transport system substrate-specific component